MALGYYRPKTHILSGLMYVIGWSAEWQYADGSAKQTELDD